MKKDEKVRSNATLRQKKIPHRFGLGFILLAILAPAFAEPAKIALVVGNAAYSGDIPTLSNPVNDATDIAATLEKRGWRVTKLVDVNRREFNRNINAFRDALKGSPGSTALFYYAGHGVQIEGKNYMLPIGEVFEAKDDVKLSAFCVDAIVDAFSEGKAKDSLIILDACREDPFAKTKTRAIGTTRGLAVISVPETEGGSATILATKAGDVAQDGDGRNGIFTEAFLKNFDSGLPLDQFFMRVKADVMAKTGGQQNPQIQTSGILSDFYLGERKEGQAAAEPLAIPVALPSRLSTPQTRTGIVTVITTDWHQASSVIVSVVRQGSGAVQDLANEGPTELAEGVYMVSAMLKDDVEPVFKRILNVDPGASVNLKLPEIGYSVTFRRKALVAEKNVILPSFKKAEAEASGQRLFGWLSLGVGLAGAGFAAYEYLEGSAAYAKYQTAATTAEADAAYAKAASSSTLFTISAAAGGLMFSVSPFLLFGDPAKDARKKIEEIDGKLVLLDQEGGSK